MYEILVVDITVDFGMKEHKDHEHEGWEKQILVFETCLIQTLFLEGASAKSDFQVTENTMQTYMI